MPPAVRNLNDLIAQYKSDYAPQEGLIDQSIASNDASGAAQVAGLTAKKDQAFTDITQGAQNKGMLFSGFTPDQEAKYTGGTFLPALANLQSTIASTRAGLLGKKADLTTDATQRARSTYEGDVSAARSWQQHQEDAARAVAEAAKQRAFEASQGAANRSASASAAAAKNATPPLAVGLAQLFTGYVPAKNGGTPMYTESTIVPQLMSAYGLSHDAALKAAYDFRKQNFKE